METDDLFSIETISDTTSRLLCDNKFFNTTIPGQILEEQYELENGFYLILTTDNCPYEKFLHILLFNRSLKLIDRIDIGQPYQSALLENVKIEKQNVVEFNFIKGYSFRLVILPVAKRFVMKRWFNGLIHYHLKFSKKYMIVEMIQKDGNPQEVENGK